MSAAILPSVAVVEPARPFWGSPLEPAGCPGCGQAFLAPSKLSRTVCPTCASATLEPQPAVLVEQPPEMLVPFDVQPTQLKAALEQFAAPVRFRVEDFSPENLAARAVPVYLPMWLVDSTLTAGWTAEVGYDYKVKTTQEAFQNEHWVTREKLEDRVRYEPRAGQLRRRYHNVTTPACSDQDALNRRAGRYEMQKAAAFQPKSIQHAILRVPDIPPASAWPAAREKLDARAASDCAKAAGGQHVRSYHHQASYTDLNWTQLLLPLYTTYYTAEDGKAYPIFINGQSGAVSGVRLASQRIGWQWTGILAGFAILLLLFGLAGFALAAVIPPLGILGGVLVVLAFSTAAAAIYPAAWVWQWNRKQPPG